MQTAPSERTSSTTGFTLSSTNYYSNAANRSYMSPTWFKKFIACEAEALAELRGDWKPQRDPTALLVGNYLHSYFESPASHKRFVEAHKDVMLSTRGKTKGQLKAPYKVSESMIKTLDGDATFQALYQGAKESIVTGTIDGIDWMGKLDCLNLERGIFLDLKTTQDLHKRVWDTRTRRYVPFVYAYDYQLQMAVYQELVRQQYGVLCTPYIVAVTKQDPPDKAVISIPQDKLDDAMWRVKDQEHRFKSIIDGQEEPERCETCDYCRSTKVLGDIIDADELID
ncbi:hypothetical protein LSP04_24290 [Levilactobacillus spicheri]|nr:hypothetical protein LSP04_24290 [Levilactobacillus spicheri]